MNFDLYGFGPALAAGALMTVKLALTALCLGLALGLAGALAKTSPYKPLQWLGGAYSTIVRGIPELLWVLLIYFGTVNLMRALGEFFGNPDLSLSAFAAGVIALGLCFGAYATEVFRGAIQAIPPGEIEAARALGMSKPKTLFYIILPRASRIGLPAYSNEVILMLKASALASTVTLLELTGMARTIIARTYLPVEIFFAAGLFYLLMAYVLVRGFKLLEKWLRVDACQGR